MTEMRRGTNLLSRLNEEDRRFIRTLGDSYRFTFQESRQMVEMARDLEMWQEASLTGLWQSAEAQVPQKVTGPQRRQAVFEKLKAAFLQIRRRPAKYAESASSPFSNGVPALPERVPLKPVLKKSDKKIFGDCPVASPETVCCNLRTIDAVENCAFGCSYCTIQTFYGSEALFDQDFRAKLKAIDLDPCRLYHYGTGQSSDSLIWGNKNGILDDLCEFALDHPNVLLEFKTKSARVDYFLGRELPENVVLSWSLNTPVICEEEEHGTASLAERLQAARRAVDYGIPAAFHFHPIVYYETWEEDYSALAREVQEKFKPEEVAFMSFGSLTFIKPVIRSIRERGGSSKVLQMEMTPAPHGKFSYPEPLKVQMFSKMHEAFRPWQGLVYRYLCMEPAVVWDQVFGRHYPDNELFEKDFISSVFKKIKKP